MEYYKQLLLVISTAIFLAGISGCKPPTGTREPDVRTFEPAFLYASDDGQVRFLNIEFTDSDTLYTITKYSTVGEVIGLFGNVYSKYDNAYDWTPFDTSSNPYVAVTLRKENPAYNPDLGPEYEYIHQVAVVSNNKRIQPLFFNSDIKENQQIQLEYMDFNKGLKGKKVNFINENTLLVYYTDFIASHEEDFANRGYLLEFNLNSFNPYQGEIIASNNIIGILGSDIPSLPTIPKPHLTHVESSAKDNFYFLWSIIPEINKYVNPFVYRRDGSFAYDPRAYDFGDYRNPPGMLIGYLEPHPRKDSVYAVADISSSFANGAENNAIHVMQLPNRKDQLPEVKHTLPYSRVMNSSRLNRNVLADVENGRDIFLKYHPSQEKLVIAQSITRPSVTVWSPNGDSTETYSIPGVSNVQMNTIGEPAWLYLDNKYLYFMAGNRQTGDNYIFYIDITKESRPAEVILWDENNVEFYQVNEDERISITKNLKGRKSLNRPF